MRIEKTTKTQTKVLEFLCDLSERERIILQLRYAGRKTQKEIAQILNITEERVRQLENRALQLISKSLK